MKLTFLGTSAMVPTKERNHIGMLLQYKGEGILFDCGENIQRQLRTAGIPLSGIKKILITHWHGDHVLGLPGLLQTLSAQMSNDTKIWLYGPKGTKKQFGLLKKALLFEPQLDISVKDVAKGKFAEAEDYYLEALPMEHSIPCLGFSFIEKDRRRIDLKKARKYSLPEGPVMGQLQDGKTVTWQGKKIRPGDVSYVVKGKKLAYVVDTAYCSNAIALAKDADLLVCEATYSDRLADKAEENMHLTAKQAGLVASNANAKKLIITHFSQRYKTVGELEEDARTVFRNVRSAHDLMSVDIT